VKQFLLGVWVIICLCSIGCDTQPRAVKTRPQSIEDVAAAEQDNLNRGLDYVFQKPEGNLREMEQMGLFHLNQWLLTTLPNEKTYAVDPLLKKISPTIAAIQQVRDVERERFTTADFRYLQARVWEKALTDWIVARPLEELYEKWVKESSFNLAEAEVTQLKKAAQLFDWVVRNIQLEPLLEPGFASASVPGYEKGAHPAAAGIPAAGYQRYPHETMLVGHGDSYERMRVFIDLCKHQQIDALVFAYRNETQQLRAWTVGVLVGKEIFLFEPELGLPLPNAKENGIATLTEIHAKPELIRQLDLSEKENEKYKVPTEAIKKLEPLLAASPEELSRRMTVLQSQLTGERQMQVAYNPQRIVERLKDFPQVNSIVALWNVPFLSCLYETGRGQRMQKLDITFARPIIMDMPCMQIGSEMNLARLQHFLGRFDKTDLERGAVQIYLNMRPTEYSLDDVRLSPEFRREVGLEQQMRGQTEESKKQTIEMYVAMGQRTRENVSFWLGIIQYEKRDFKTAVDWFKERSLTLSPDNFWTRSIKYNLARSYEQLGDYNAALKLYHADLSPQRHGNKIRARIISQSLQPVSETETKTAETEPMKTSAEK
jgi:tetratricopeptide (TPR) repeat protein